MQDNPFASMLEIVKAAAREQIVPAFRIGEVISTSPLKIDVAGTPQDRDTLRRNAKIENLSAGDRVLLACLDGDQRFIVLCKVVDV